MVLLHTQQTVKYFRVVPAAVWAADYFLTLEHEVRLFSTIGRWNIATVMFIVARYSPIVWIVGDIYVTLGSQSEDSCLTTYRVAGTAMVLILVASEGLLLIRTLALWHDNQKIKRILLIIYFLVVFSIFIYDIFVSSLLRGVCLPTSSIAVATEVERLIMAMFVCSALFELTAIIATLYHATQSRSTCRCTVSKLALTLWKGSLLYAISLLAISVVNIVTLSLPISSGLNGIMDVFQGVLHGVLASRILFDLRAGAVEHDEEHSDNIQFTSIVYTSSPQSSTSQTVDDENNV